MASRRRPRTTIAHYRRHAPERLRRESRLGTSAVDAVLGKAYRRAKQSRGRDLQFDQDGYKVKVKSGHDGRSNQYTTDIIIIDPADHTGHWHFVIDEWGKVVLNQWNENH